MTDLILFPDNEHSQSDISSDKGNFTINDYFNSEQNYWIMSQIQKTKDNEYLIIPTKDKNTLIRAFYISILNQKSDDQKMNTINKINQLINKITNPIVLHQIENVNLKYLFLFKIQNLRKLYLQFIEKWKEAEIKSIFFLCNAYPIIDYILVVSLRMILICLGYNHAYSFNSQIEYDQLLKYFDGYFDDYENKIIMDKQIKVKLKLTQNDIDFFQQNFLNIKHPQQESQPVPPPPLPSIKKSSLVQLQKDQKAISNQSQTTFKKSTLLQIESILIESSISKHKTMKEPSKKLQNLHSCIFFSLIN